MMSYLSHWELGPWELIAGLDLDLGSWQSWHSMGRGLDYGVKSELGICEHKALGLWLCVCLGASSLNLPLPT